MTPLLQIDELRTEFDTEDGTIRAVDGVNLSILPGEILGLVGESGCGKTVTGLSVLGLIQPPGRVAAGRILFEGEDLLTLPPSKMSSVRGASIGMIFQQPKTCLDPLMRIGAQVADILIRRDGQTRRAAWSRAIELLAAVGIPSPEIKALAYPHQISGGQAQRVMIAIALALRPRLLIADEPTTALDVTVQAQVLNLLQKRCRETGTALILITHDLGVVAQMADRVAVMYAGQIVEESPVGELFACPGHPYTQGLLRAIPVLGGRQPRLAEIGGIVPTQIGATQACRFAPRCEVRTQLGLGICTTAEPALGSQSVRHQVRCWAAAANAHPVKADDPPSARPVSASSGARLS
jgi:peptide/nickel transport system ATP-binding protein